MLNTTARGFTAFLLCSAAIAAHVNAGSADLKISGATVTPANPQVGDTVQYRCFVTNTGPDTPASMHGYVGPDQTSDADMTFDHGNPPPFNTDNTGFRYFHFLNGSGQTVSTLTSGQTCYFDVFYKAVQAGTSQRLIGVSSDDPNVSDPNPGNDSTTSSVTIGAGTQSNSASATVPGSADPWLAGMPDGSTTKSDTAPQESPVLVQGLPIDAGTIVTFTVSGSVDFNGGTPADPPDGSSFFYSAPADGMSGCNYPLNALIGVFLDADQPDQLTPPADLDFSSTGNVQGGTDYSQLRPQLRQVFFVGDGRTSTGQAQQIIAPQPVHGSLRLYLGTSDGSGWYNNTGSFSVTVAAAAGQSSGDSCTIQFSDVATTDAFYPFIHCLTCRGIMSGYSDGTFKPLNSATRGQAAKVMALASGFSGTPASPMPFADVPDSNPFYSYIEQLGTRGIASGYNCGGASEPCVEPQNAPYFRPANNVTRGQFAKIIAAAQGFNEPVSGQTFADVAPTNLFYAAIERLQRRSVISGYSCGGAGEPCDAQSRPYFRPFADITRGQMAKIVALVLSDCVTPPSQATQGPDLSVNVRVSPDPARVGETVTYHCVVTNIGSADAAAASAYLSPDNSGTTDQYETFQSSTPSSTDLNGYRAVDIPALAPNASFTFDVVYTENAAGAPQRSFYIYSPSDPNNLNDEVTVPHTIAAAPNKPVLPGIHLLINGSESPTIQADSPILFEAAQNVGIAGMYARVQATTTPNDEGSWTDLNDGNAGHMVRTFDPNLHQDVWVLTTTAYPLAQNVHFRVIAAASGYTDSISNIIGAFDLRSNASHLGATHFTMQGSTQVFNVGPASDIHFEATQSSTSGATLTLQYSTAPYASANWQNLATSNNGVMTQYGSDSRWYIDSNQYPSGDNVYFRVVTTAAGAVPSFSNEIGPFVLVHDVPPAVTINSPQGVTGTGTASDPIQLQVDSGSGQATFTFGATATPDAGRSIADLYLVLDDTVVGHSTSGSASAQYSTSVLGLHALRATAVDELGGYGYAGPVYVMVRPAKGTYFEMTQSGNWTEAANWKPSFVPGDGDVAYLGSFAATIPSGSNIIVAALAGGNLNGPGTLTVTQGFYWYTGTLGGGLVLNIPTGSEMRLVNAGKAVFGSVTLNNSGTLSASLDSGGGVTANVGAKLYNKGKIYITANANAATQGLIDFSNGFLKNSGYVYLNNVVVLLPKKPSGTSAANMRASTEPSGQDSGQFDLGPADHPSTIIGDVLLAGGILTGSGTINGDLYNTGGIVAPGHSVGSLTITGNYTQTSQGTLVIEVAGEGSPTSPTDQITVIGTANLAGTIDLRPVGESPPGNSQSFVPLTYGAVNGSFDKVSNNASLTLNPNGAVVTVDPTIAAPKSGQPLNISTRMQVLSNDNVLIAGFIVTGPSGSTKKVMIRGLGPSLTSFGISTPLTDPLLELHNPDGSVVANDNWQDASNVADIPNGFQPTDPRESVIVATLSPGNYTAVLRGAHGEIGIGLAEAYDLDTASPAQLANISTRGFVDTGDNVMIGGFIVGGTEPAKILVRAIGPSLRDANVEGALSSTALEVHDANGAVLRNEGWRSTQEQEIIATTIPPTNDGDSAVLATLVPGNYTAVVRGKDNTTGVGLVEAYNLQ